MEPERIELSTKERERVKAMHVWRPRRSAFGELVMMDSSPYRWLEERGPACHLVALIDDATSRVWGRLVEHDSTEENLRTLGGWLVRHGRPLALYTDKNSLFHTSRPVQWQEQLRGDPERTQRLEEILSVRVARTVAADHTVSWQAQRWGLRRENVCAGLRGARVEIERRLGGSHWLRFRGRYLPLQPCPAAPRSATPSGLRPTGLADQKPKPPTKIKTKRIPSPDHPWRKPWKRTFLLGRKPDISTWQKTGHFYFALTEIRPGDNGRAEDTQSNLRPRCRALF